MAGRIRQEDLEAVRERTDIVKLIGGYLALSKAGPASLKGICPFHTEKTPSLSVSASKQVYYCFGCKATGDAITFLKEVESLSFSEAVERLAKDAGITLRHEGESPAERRAASRRQALYDANARAADLYHTMLLEGREGEEARAYLEGRGIDRSAVERFGVGYAPRYPDFLLRRLSPRLGPEILAEAGLVAKDAQGTARDRFRGRITFPVHDLSGRAVGFGARLLPNSDGSADNLPKYVNSPETPVYRKGEMLYNLNRAKPTVARTSEAFVVEGYTDVMALDLAGVESAVATCGTALSEGHFRLLARFGTRAVLAFDSDEAGAHAAERAYAFHERFELEAVVLVLPEGLDPAELVRTRGGEAFRELAARAVPLVEYMIDRSLASGDLRSLDGRANAVRRALPIVAGLRDRVRREQYAHLLADRAGVSDTAVLLELERTGAPQDREAVGDGAPAATHVPRMPREHHVEREMLKLLIQDAESNREVMGRLEETHFDRAQHRKLFAALSRPGAEVRTLVSEIEDDRLRDLLVELTVEEPEGDAGPGYAWGVLSRLEEFSLSRRIAAVRKRLQVLNAFKDPEYDGLFEELVQLEGERRRIRARDEPA